MDAVEIIVDVIIIAIIIVTIIVAAAVATIAEKKEEERTGQVSEMGVTIPAAAGATKKIARHREAEACIGFRSPLLHRYGEAGCLCYCHEIIQTQFPGVGHMLDDMIKVSKEIQDNAWGENVAESLFRWKTV